MTYVRSVVLRSSSLRIGDHLELQAAGPKGPWRIGDLSAIRLFFRTARPVGNLTVVSAEGASVRERELSVTGEGEGQAADLFIELEGAEGRSTLAISIITADLGATAGSVEVGIDARPRRTALSLLGAPYIWTGEGTIALSVRLENPLRVKGELSADLISPDGDAVRLKAPVKVKVSFKGELTEELTFEPLGTCGPGHYDVAVALKGDTRAEAVFEDAVHVPEHGPELGIAEAGAGSWARTGIPASGASEVRLVTGGDEMVLRTRDGGGSLEVLIPEDVQGNVRISVLRGTHEICSGSVVVLPRSVLGDVALSSGGGPVRAGTETTCTISYTKREDLPLKAVLTIGGEGQVRTEAMLGGTEGIAEVRVKVPEEMPSGVQPAVLEVLLDGVTIHRSVKAELFIVVSDISASVVLDVPIVEGEGDTAPYLFPGEVVVSSETMGRMTVESLSTGRRVLHLDGRRVMGKGWDGRSDEDSLMNYTLFMYKEALSDQEFRRRLREGAKRVEDLMGPPKMVPVGELPPVSRSYSDLVSGKRTDPLVREVASFVNTIMAGRDASAHRLMEHAAALWKGSARPDMSGAVGTLTGCARAASGSIAEVTAAGSAGPERMDRALEELVFLSLLQAEVVSAWSDPALSAWDDLRVLRQRSIRRSVDSGIAALDAIAAVAKRAAGRFAAYRTNMAVRRNLHAVRDLRLKTRAALSTTGTGTLKGSVTLVGGDLPAFFDMLLVLPHHSWGVVAPNPARERDGFYIGHAELSPGQSTTISVELSVPQGSKGGEVVLFVRPTKAVLEEEP